MTESVNDMKSAPGEPCRHPLLNSSVVEVLFGFLGIDVLKRCRGVCKVWDVEAFRQLRKRTLINLNTAEKIEDFIGSGVAASFSLFPLVVCKWNERIATLVSKVQPGSLYVEVDIDIDAGNDTTEPSEDLENNDLDVLGGGRPDRGNSLGLNTASVIEDPQVQAFLQLLSQYRDILISLKVNLLRDNFPASFSPPTNLLEHKYKSLKRFGVTNKKSSVKTLHELFLSIFRNSLSLDSLTLTNFNADWDKIRQSPNFDSLKELEYVTKSPSYAVEIQHILENNMPTALTRLCIPFQQDVNEALVTRLLQKVSQTLQVLEFHTQDETALSPIAFPVLPSLRILDSGCSQLSFPTIEQATFPQLSEIRATYWDWVFTREFLPDVNYYWRSNPPHFGVRNVHIRFPDWSSVDIDYQRLENFESFAEVIAEKFPTATNFFFHNVPLMNDIRQGLEKFAEAHEFSMTKFEITNYSADPGSVSEPYCPFELNTTAEGCPRARSLEVLDLGPQNWLRIARQHEFDWICIRNEWISSIFVYNQLKVLKLLWGQDLLGQLDLKNPHHLPNLTYLEFVGNKCVDRFERAKVRHARPLLKINQLKKCNCYAEDWWYMHDENSQSIFKKLFSTKYAYSKSFLDALLFRRLFRSLKD